MKSAKITSIVSYISTAFYILAGLLYLPYLIRTLGVSDYGIYALATSLIGYFSLDFGIGAAQTRLAARYLAEGKEYKIRDMLGITSRIFLAIDLIILILCTVVYFYSESIFSNLSSDEIIRFKNVFILTSLFVLINFPLLPSKGLYQAYDCVYNLAIIDLVYKIANVLVIVAALYFGFGLYGVVVANISSSIIAQLFRLFYIFNKKGLSINIHARDHEVVKFITSFSMWATVAMVADKFFFGAIPFLLAAFANTKEVAFFAIVISIEGYTLSISRSLSGIFLPRVMKMVVMGDDSHSKILLMTRVGRIQLYIVGLIVVGLISMGNEFIFHWLGTGFEKSYYCLILVLFPCLFHLTQTIGEELLLATNQVKYRALAYCIGSSISFLCIICLSPSLGALAAALGCFFSFIIAHNVIIDIVYYKKLGLDMFYFLSHCHLKILPSFLVCGFLGYLMQLYIATPSMFLFFIKLLCWSILSIVILWFTAFNADEKNMLKQIIHSRK